MMNLMVVDPTNIVQNLFEYAFSAYDILGVYKYPLLIVAAIGFVYLSTKSATLAILTVVVAFCVFGAQGMFAQTFLLNNLLAVLSVFGIAALFLGLILKKQIQEVVSGD